MAERTSSSSDRRSMAVSRRSRAARGVGAGAPGTRAARAVVRSRHSSCTARRETGSKFTLVRVENRALKAKSSVAVSTMPASRAIRATAASSRSCQTSLSCWMATASFLPQMPRRVQALPLEVCSHWLQNMGAPCAEGDGCMSMTLEHISPATTVTIVTKQGIFSQIRRTAGRCAGDPAPCVHFQKRFQPEASSSRPLCKLPPSPSR